MSNDRTPSMSSMKHPEEHRRRPLPSHARSVARALGAAAIGVLGLGVQPSASLGADTCPNAEVRAQQDAHHLGSCRAYELVSPAEKGGGAVFLAPGAGSIGITRPSLDGNALTFTSWAPIADGEGGMPLSYRATRDASGWTSKAVSPGPKGPNPNVPVAGALTAWVDAARDLSRGFAFTTDPQDSSDVDGTYDIYETGAGSPKWLTRGNSGEVATGSEGHQFGRGLGAVSPDGKHVIFRSSAHLVPEDAGRTAGHDLYERFDGKTYLVSQADNGSLLSPCGSNFAQRTTRNAISDDGEHVTFETPDAASGCGDPTEVYQRVGRSSTIHVSASQRAVPDPGGNQPKYLRGVSADGDKVFFESSELLSDDATGPGWYRYTVSSGHLEQILDTWVSPLVFESKISPDGNVMYFVSLLDHAPGAVFGNSNLYYLNLSSGEIRFLGTDPTYSFDTTFAQANEDGRQANVTADGQHFLFVTHVQLTAHTTGDKAQVYLYDAAASKLTCISCDPAGQRPSGSAQVSDAAIKSDLSATDDQGAAISADGRIAVFDTADQLVPEDTNKKRDVYEYRDGKLSLVSSGHDANDVTLIGLGGGGRDVFFATSARLVASDVDGGNVDVYDARIDGGYREVVTAPLRECSEDECQGGAAVAPVLPSIGSASFAGSGNSKPSSGSKPPLIAVSPLKTITGSAASLKVRVPGAGKIAVSGSAIRKASVSSSRAASYTVKLRLSSSAAKRLRKERVLKVAVRVSYRSSDGRLAAKNVTVTFKQPKPTRGKNRKGGR